MNELKTFRIQCRRLVELAGEAIGDEQRVALGLEKLSYVIDEHRKAGTPWGELPFPLHDEMVPHAERLNEFIDSASRASPERTAEFEAIMRDELRRDARERGL